MSAPGSLALIAGQGGLAPALLAALPTRPLVAALEGATLAPGLTPDLTFRPERLALFFRDLAARGIEGLVFAGAMARPRLDPALVDPQSAQLLPALMAALAAGDDATLRAVIGLCESAGFAVLGVEAVAPALLPGAGHWGAPLPPSAEGDAQRAAAIVAALGAADVGQGAVVEKGLCLAVEALGGTDFMLQNLAALPKGLRPGGGLLYKAAKPGQDRRADLPTLGPASVQAAAAAGLSGIAFAAGDVICLDFPAMQAAAAKAGLFLWGRAP